MKKKQIIQIVTILQKRSKSVSDDNIISFRLALLNWRGHEWALYQYSDCSIFAIVCSCILEVPS